MKTRRLILLAALLTAVITAGAADKVEFTAQAPKSVVKGENFRLVYTVNARNGKKMRMPAVEEFSVLAGPSTSSRSSTTIVNGKMESAFSVSYTYILAGEEEGTFTIPGGTIEVDGETYTSNSVKIQVLPPDETQTRQSGQQQSGGAAQGRTSQPSSSSGGISNSDLFMRAIVSKTTVHEQEALLLTFKVYSLVNLRSLSNKIPDLKNFYVQEVELPQNKEFTLEHYNGRNYQTLVWSQYVLFPQQAGDLEIPSMTFEGVVAQQIESTDIFDIFFNSGRMVETKKELVTDKITVHVDPLPSGKSPAFSGGVGDFSISSNISTTDLKANEAVTIQIVVSGTGNMKLIKTPEVKYPNDFDIYDPKVDNKYSLKTNGQSGNKVFEYLAIPRYAGTYTIPPVEFQYFDVASGTYKTLQTDAYTLNVAKGEGSETQTISGYVSKEDLKFVGEDVRFHWASGKLFSLDGMFFGSALFWALLALPAIILAVLLIMRSRQSAEQANVAQTKRKKASSAATKRLKTAGKLMAAGQSGQFYDEVLKALWGYVSDKLVMPVSSLSKDNIESELRARNVSEDLISQFTRLLGDCEFARYAPGDETGRMDRIYADAESVISQMENTIKK